MLAEIDKRIRQYEVRLEVLEEKIDDRSLNRKKRELLREDLHTIRDVMEKMEASVQSFEEQFLEDFPEPKQAKPQAEVAEFAVERTPTGINFLMITFIVAVGMLIYWAVSNSQ